VRPLTRRTAAALAVCLGTVVPAGSAFASATTDTTAGGPSTAVLVDNSAVSVNTTDNTSVFHLGFTIVQSSGASVAVSNVALAVTSCANCSSTAIAIQVDLVWPVPLTLTATNVAVAVNNGCATCDALSFAFQYVIASNQRMALTRRGRHEVAQIEQALAALQSSSLSGSALTASVTGLATQLGGVLKTELVAVHRGDDGGDRGVDHRQTSAGDRAGDGRQTGAGDRSTEAQPTSAGYGNGE
jgi:hypothetical protein